MFTNTNKPGKPKRKGPNIQVVAASAAQARHLNVEGEPITRTHGGIEPMNSEPSLLRDVVGDATVELIEAGATITGEAASKALETGVEVVGGLASKAIEAAGDVIS